MSGYYGYSFSNNYLQAYNEGKRCKSDILKIVGRLPKGVSFEKVFGKPCEWHHTSKYYNITYMWDIEPDYYDFVKQNKDKLKHMLYQHVVGNVDSLYEWWLDNNDSIDVSVYKTNREFDRWFETERVVELQQRERDKVSMEAFYGLIMLPFEINILELAKSLCCKYEISIDRVYCDYDTKHKFFLTITDRATNTELVIMDIKGFNRSFKHDKEQLEMPAVARIDDYLEYEENELYYIFKVKSTFNDKTYYNVYINI
ncbi:MAG: hypothetical protein QXS54_03890 [Candidatus Methanomethylicaceae archaeon]